MTNATEPQLLEPLLDSWDRNNRMLVNLLSALPAGGLEARAMATSPSVAEMLMHIHYVRLVFVQENAPEFARPVPEQEWRSERDPGVIAQMLNESAQVVRDAVEGRLRSGRNTERHYDHPVLFLQHMLWHEGYHHGQVKLALKLSGHALSDDVAGPVTWALLTRKRKG